MDSSYLMLLHFLNNKKNKSKKTISYIYNSISDNDYISDNDSCISKDDTIVMHYYHNTYPSFNQ